MKKVISILTAILTMSALIVNICAVPYSHGGIIGDMKESGYISGYRSLLTVFGMDDDGYLLAIGTTAYEPFIQMQGSVMGMDFEKSYPVSCAQDVYDLTEYRCGNADDTGFFDEAIPVGFFDNNDYAIYKVRQNELQPSIIAENYAVGDSVKIYSVITGTLGHEYIGEITSVSDGYLTYTSNIDYDPPEYSNSDYLAPVYTENDELIGVIISENTIITVEQIYKLMASEHYIAIFSDDDLDKFKSSIVPPDDSYTPAPSSNPFGLSGLFDLFGKITSIIWLILHSIL